MIAKEVLGSHIEIKKNESVLISTFKKLDNDESYTSKALITALIPSLYSDMSSSSRSELLGYMLWFVICSTFEACLKRFSVMKKHV